MGTPNGVSSGPEAEEARPREQGPRVILALRDCRTHHPPRGAGQELCPPCRAHGAQPPAPRPPAPSPCPLLGPSRRAAGRAPAGGRAGRPWPPGAAASSPPGPGWGGTRTGQGRAGSGDSDQLAAPMVWGSFRLLSGPGPWAPWSPLSPGAQEPSQKMVSICPITLSAPRALSSPGAPPPMSPPRVALLQHLSLCSPAQSSFSAGLAGTLTSWSQAHLPTGACACQVPTPHPTPHRPALPPAGPHLFGYEGQALPQAVQADVGGGVMVSAGQEVVRSGALGGEAVPSLSQTRRVRP